MSLRILIADDHPTVRRTLKQLLENNEEWQVCGDATNGQEAVQKAALLKPDVIILDASMPVMNGYEAASHISSASPDMPILIYTQFAAAPKSQCVGVRQIINKGSPHILLSALKELQAEIDARTSPLDRNLGKAERSNSY